MADCISPGCSRKADATIVGLAGLCDEHGRRGVLHVRYDATGTEPLEVRVEEQALVAALAARVDEVVAEHEVLGTS